MNRVLLLLLSFYLLNNLVAQQQVPDLDFPIQIDVPSYPGDRTALIGIDASHHNFHKLDGGFSPFAKLMNADGYQLKSVTKITEEELTPLNVMVIANALHESNVGNWKRPIAAAFSAEEIQMLENWVSNGGSLLVIADHMPFAGASNTLAAAFGFTYEDGFVMHEQQIWPPETYSKKQGNLYETIVTKNIDSLAGFTGSALRAPEDAIKIASFPATHKLLVPEVAWQFETNTKTSNTEGLVMGALKNHGKGKVAFFTEAAMFTAQIVQDKYKVGFNARSAPQNKQFVLNVLHWLDNGKTQKREVQNAEEMRIVKEVLGQQAKAYEANRMEEVASYYSTDAIIYEPTGAETRGIDDITAYWQQLKGMAISWKTEILEVEAIGEQVLAVCRFDISYKTGERDTLTAKSKAILTFKKENGVYKIFRDFYMPVK